ncbi:MAG: diguanylate cyclase [Solidesulfovibrio sp.]
MKITLPLHSKIHQFFEIKPVRSVCVAIIMSIPLIVTISWIYTNAWRTKTIDKAITAASARSENQKAILITEVKTKFYRIRNVSQLLARETDLVALLTYPTPALEEELNRYLMEFTQDLELHRAYILDAKGICVASNDFADPESLVGTSFQDRDYFQATREGRQGIEFLVGRVSSEPGFHFASPIRSRTAILGAAVVKIDLADFANRLHFKAGFVTDDQGIVVLSDDPTNLLRAVPDAPALGFTHAERLRRYQREQFSILPITASDALGTWLYTYGETPSAPSIMQVVALPEEKLTVYFFQEVEGLRAINAQFGIRLYLASLVLTFVLVLMLSLYAYLARDAYLRRNLRELNEKLKIQAQHDALTGCWNRRKFNEVLHQEAYRSSRTGHPLALAMLDLDHFKQVNDRHGHAVGDRTLMHVTSIFRENLRQTDTLARIGGEEFAIVLPETDEQQAQQLMHRLALCLARQPLEGDGYQIAQTASIGVAASSGAQDSENLMQEADVALYVAKKSGRNRVVAASSIKDTFHLQHGNNTLAPDRSP